MDNTVYIDSANEYYNMILDVVKNPATAGCGSTEHVSMFSGIRSKSLISVTGEVIITGTITVPLLYCDKPV